MSKLRTAVFLAGLVVVTAGLLPARAAVPSGYQVVSQKQLGSGVDYSNMKLSSPAEDVHVAHLAAGAPVALLGVNSHDLIPHGSANGDLELPSSMCRRVQCIAGVNADFHDVSSDEPLGGVVSGGRMLRSPVSTHEQFSITNDGRFTAGTMTWTGVVRSSDAAVVNLSALNRARAADQVVLYTPAWGSATRASGGTELVVRAAGPVGTLGQPTLVQVVSRASGKSAIPADGAVLSGSGAGAVLLDGLWNKLQRGAAEPRIELRIDASVPAAESLGAHPVILQGGRSALPAQADGFTVKRNPRTVIGWNPAGEVFVVVADGRREGAKGLSLLEAANFLLALGATDAVNFDGGGGSVFVIGGTVVNTPVDKVVGEERGAPSGLMIVAKAPVATPGPAPAPVPVTPYQAPPVIPAAPAPRSSRFGYRMVVSGGTVFGFGDAAGLGNAPVPAGAQAVDLETTPSGNGYWVVDDAGRVYGVGDARWLGNADGAALAPGERVTSLSATPSGAGYWMFTGRGRVLSFGDAHFLGDMSKVALNGPVLDSIPTPSGQGYYMVASDGGIFTFGDARFLGSMGGKKLNAPVQSLVPDPDGTGYWLVASDGGVFAFEAPFKGSMGGQPLNRPITGMVPLGNGYLMVGQDGGLFNFSDRGFLGSLGDNPPAQPVTSVSVLDR